MKDGNAKRTLRKSASPHTADLAAGVPHPITQPHQWEALERLLQTQKRRGGKVRVRFVRITTQPLDPDNHGGSVKAALDCLRQAFPSLIPDDNPEVIDLILEQVRCARESEQGTLIEVFARDSEAGGTADDG